MHFSKMHGIGNDFMIVDAITQDVFFSSALIRHLADRHVGVGFDQLLIVEPPYDPNFDFHYRIFNANGNEVTQCGNGARCFACFVHLKGLTRKKNIYVTTSSKNMVLTIIKENLVRVNMGEPVFKASEIPFLPEKVDDIFDMCEAKHTVLCGIVSVGNPHCIIQVNNLETAPIKTLGPVLEVHESFPKCANIDFMQIIQSKYIRLRVYERGSNETQACGSGACASVAVGIIRGLLEKQVCVELPGGKLDITWKGPGYPLYMTGPATFVYDGFIRL